MFKDVSGLVFISVLASCHQPLDSDALLDPDHHSGSCVEGVLHSSAVQALEIRNATTTELKVLDFKDYLNEAATFGNNSISLKPNSTHTLHFVVDSFENGGSMVWQSTESGKKSIGFDKSCFENPTAPLYIIHSGAATSWLGIRKEGEEKPIILRIGLADTWAESVAPAHSHYLVISASNLQNHDEPSEPHLVVSPRK